MGTLGTHQAHAGQHHHGAAPAFRHGAAGGQANFGAVSLMVNDKPHFLGIMLWGEDKGNTFTSSLYDGDDDNIRDVWFDCVEKMHSLWFGKKVIEGKFSGYLDINYLPFSTQAEAWEYVNNIATIDEGYYDEFEFTI